MFLKPFLKYLKPHKLRLVIALIGMILVSFFGVFNIMLIIPALDTMFQKDGQAQTVVSVVDDRSGEAIPGARVEVRKAGESGVSGISDEQGSVQLAEPLPEEQKSTGLKQRIQNRFMQFELVQRLASIKDTFYNRYTLGSDADKMKGLMIIVAVLIASGILKGISEFVSEWALSHAFYRVALDIREDLFRHIINLDYLFYSRYSTGYLESRIQNDTTGIRDVLQTLSRGAVQEPFNIFGLLVLLFFLSPLLTLVVMLVTPFAFLALLYFARKLRRVTRRQRRKQDALNSVMEEALRNYKIIQTYHTSDHEVGRFVKENNKIFDFYMKARIAKFASSPIVENLGTVGMGGVILLGGWMIISGNMQSSDYIVYLIALARIYGPIRRMTKINVVWQQARVSAQRIQEIFSHQSSVQEAPDALPIKTFEKEIAFKDVTLRYGEKTIIDKLSYTVPKGRVVAIVGKTGAGKTTMINLLCRLIDPSEGRIEIDGVDIRRYQLEDLRRLFGIVTQEIILFDDTVANNIAYGEPEIDMKRVEVSARAANAHDFIMHLEGGKGYETRIGMDGQRLSGGQRQRLAIARAIYRNPQILIFDEATSSLDEETQQQVQQAIDHLLENRTAFVIAHRLSTIRHADEILVLDEGRLIERGSHEHLLSRKTHYSRLYNLADDLAG